uniref:ABC-2 type transporter transmembrane domain-containing protein n=1 Tax=Vitis vinifera TaxID=29760 RepID=F6HX65_VITVI
MKIRTSSQLGPIKLVCFIEDRVPRNIILRFVVSFSFPSFTTIKEDLIIGFLCGGDGIIGHVQLHGLCMDCFESFEPLHFLSYQSPYKPSILYVYSSAEQSSSNGTRQSIVLREKKGAYILRKGFWVLVGSFWFYRRIIIFLSVLKDILNTLRILPSRKKKFTILHDVSGIIRPRRMTLLLGPPSSEKTTLLLDLYGILDSSLKIDTFFWLSADMLAELSRREKAANIMPDPDIDAFMKVRQKLLKSYKQNTLMLEVTISAQELILGVNFTEIYKNSDIYRRNKDLIKELSQPTPSSKDLYFPNQYSQPFFTQCMACLWKQCWSYWRNPPYTAVRFFFTTFIALMFGTMFWDLGTQRTRQRDLSNAMGSM